jgi:D-alanyl-D-alanine carboxypeptidase/D-alanyl-D-alanine-endopeptidase (penicillin-binding protein 4)
VFRRRRRYGLPLIVVLIAVVLTAVLLGNERLVHTRADTRPPGSLPGQETGTAALAALSRGAPVPTSAGLRAALDPLVRVPALAPTVVGAVSDTRNGHMAYALSADAAVPPASTAKLVTAAAALTALGPDAVFRTRTMLGPLSGTTRTVTLVGGGDPTLASPRAVLPSYPEVAHLTDLVKATAAQLTARKVHTVHVVIDDTLFAGPTTAPGWKPNYVSDGDVSPVTALSVDAGRLRPDNNSKTPDDRASDPSMMAGRQFASLLSRAHVHVVGAVSRTRMPTGSVQVASVSSPPLSALVTRMLQRSDNDVAESLLRHIAIARHQAGSFAGGAIAVHQWLTTLHVDVRAAQLVDGSGLSLRDRLSPRILTTVLYRVAKPGSTLRPIVAALPVAGFSGTLGNRYRLEPHDIVPTVGAGVVRAKTGTLTGVSALAGLVEDSDGRLLAFAFVADAVPLGGLTAAEKALDQVATRLATCGCR